MLRKKKQRKERLILLALMSLAINVCADSMAAAENKPSFNLPKIFVEADRGTLPGEFVRESGQTGLMGYRKAMDIPFHQINLTQKTIDIFSANPSEASVSVLANIPAIRSAGSTLYNDFSFRGQTANAYQFRINGIPNMLSQTNIPMNFVEGVDVISGASIGINGSGASESAGGTINMITKRAHEDFIKYTTGFSGRNIWSNNIDVSKRFGLNNDNGIRFNASHSKGDTGISNEEVKNTTFSLNYDHETKNSETNFFIGYRDTRTSQAVRYFDFSNKAITKMPEAPDGSTNYAFKGATVAMRTYMATLNHVQKLSDKTKAFFNFGKTYNHGYDYLVPYSSRYNIINDSGDFSRNIIHSPFVLRNTYVQGGLDQEWNIGVVKNKTVIAFDKNWYKTQWGESGLPEGTVTGNLYTGNINVTGITPAIGYGDPSKTQYYGWSAINEATFGKTLMTIGLHHHTSRVTNSSGRVIKTSGTSPMYGVVYKPTDRISIFANHTESFHAGKVVGSAYHNSGDILAPAKTKSNEIGVKYTNKRFLTGLSFFDMQKQAEFNDNDYLTLNGRLKYKGVEFTIGGEIIPKWSLNGGLLYTDSKYKKTNASQSYLEGKGIKGTSKWSAVSVLQYSPSKEFSIFGRMIYIGKAPLYTSLGTELTIPSSTVFDLGVNYKTKLNKTPVTLTATVYNLFDRNYWMPRATYNYGILGNPRTFAVNATFEF